MVDIVIGGDADTLLEAVKAIQYEIPLVVCNGTGGIADKLCDDLEQIKR